MTKIHTFSISPFPGMCSDPYESIHIALSVRVGNQPVPPALNMTGFQTLVPIPRDVNSRCHINKSTDGWVYRGLQSEVELSKTSWRGALITF